MKTKFFKRLSFVLVVAMVLSLFVPAAGAFAAKAPKLNSTKKYLHLDVDKLNEYNFNVANKQKGWKYFWESANEDVAVVNEKNGVTTATGVGKTKVTLYITNADDEKVQNLSATVTVRDNIKEVTVKNPVDTLAVGEEHDYNRSFVTVSGSTKKTSAITRWVVEPSENASIDDKGVFVATEAGEYTITALSFQSKARYNNWLKDAAKYADYVLDTDETKVVVGASMVDAKQVDADTVKVNFDSAMENVDGIEVYQVVGTANAKELIKEAKLADDKMSADITVYVPFREEATYIVEFAEMEAVSFVAARKKVEDVAYIQIDTSKAVVNTPTDVVVKVFNSNDVDISDGSGLADRVTLKSDNEVGTYLDANAKQVLIFEKDLTTKVTATFHTYNWDSNTGEEIGNIETVAVILGVDQDSTNLTSIKSWTIVNDAKPDFDKTKTVIAVEDTGYRLYVRFNTKTGNEDGSVDSFKDGVTNGDFEFVSSDETTMIVGTDGSLYPIKQGSVDIIVKYGTNSSADKVPVGVIRVTIGPKSKATNLVLGTSSIVLSNIAAVADSKDVSLKVTDQAGRELDVENLMVEKLSGPADKEVTNTPNAADKKVTFSGVGATEGTYSYKITANDISRVVSVRIATTEDAKPARYDLRISDTTVDLKVENKKVTKDITIELVGMANNGTDMTKESFIAYGATPVKDDFRLEIIAPKDGADWDYDAEQTTTFDESNGKYGVVTLTNGTSGDAITKAPLGSYKVTAYQYRNRGTDADPNMGWVAFAVKYFSLNDTQAKPALTKVKDQLFTGSVDPTNQGALIAAVKNCFEIKLNGTEMTDIIKVDATGTSTSIYIKSITVRQKFDVTSDNDAASYVDHEVSIGLTIKQK